MTNPVEVEGGSFAKKGCLNTFYHFISCFDLFKQHIAVVYTEKNIALGVTKWLHDPYVPATRSTNIKHFDIGILVGEKHEVLRFRQAKEILSFLQSSLAKENPAKPSCELY